MTVSERTYHGLLGYGRWNEMDVSTKGTCGDLPVRPSEMQCGMSTFPVARCETLRLFQNVVCALLQRPSRRGLACFRIVHADCAVFERTRHSSRLQETMQRKRGKLVAMLAGEQEPT
jgi:hypothetical protein